MKLLARLIWNFSEWSGIGLGRFAPSIFGLMIERKPYLLTTVDEGSPGMIGCSLLAFGGLTLILAWLLGYLGGLIKWVMDFGS